jgi:arsenate reductase
MTSSASFQNPFGNMHTVLFICEHGSAKSVVAAAHFNRLAVERGLDVRAVSRGTEPDTENHPAAVNGLKADGLQPQAEPCQLLSVDLETAARIIAFSELPAGYPERLPLQVWTVPPVSENYEVSRDSIVDHIERLLEDLAEQR